MNFNLAIIAGYVTRDPDIRSLPSGQPVASFSVASNRYYTDKSGNRQENAEFHNVVAFGRWADICSRYVSKGTPMLVKGRLQTRSWQGQDGVKRSRTEIIAEFLQLGGRGKSEKAEFTSETAAKSQPPKAPAEDIPVIEEDEPISTEEEIEVKDIPF